jgi:hypothetical protein
MTVLRIWDLRRGDDDDNRTSPHGRGLRSIVLSTLLEFNPLKASIGFLALILGPALLVGIAPSIVVTYGRLTFHKLTLAGSYPIVALVSLAVLVGAALLDRPTAARIGCRLFLASPLHPRRSNPRRLARASAGGC